MSFSPPWRCRCCGRGCAACCCPLPRLLLLLLVPCRWWWLLCCCALLAGRLPVVRAARTFGARGMRGARGVRPRLGRRLVGRCRRAVRRWSGGGAPVVRCRRRRSVAVALRSHSRLNARAYAPPCARAARRSSPCRTALRSSACRRSARSFGYVVLERRRRSLAEAPDAVADSYDGAQVVEAYAVVLAVCVSCQNFFDN